MKDRKRPNRSSLRFIRADEPTLLEATPTGSEATLQNKMTCLRSLWGVQSYFGGCLSDWSSRRPRRCVLQFARLLSICTFFIIDEWSEEAVCPITGREHRYRTLPGLTEGSRKAWWAARSGVQCCVLCFGKLCVCVCVCTRGDVGQLPVEATRRHNDNSSRGNNQSTPRWF